MEVSKRHHTVPNFYLKGFASADKRPRIGAASLDDGRRLVVPTSDATVRKNFYSLDGHPDGPDVFEKELSNLEMDASAVIKKAVAGAWPLTREDREILGTFLAFQFLRGLAPGYGLFAAAYVSIPAFPDEPTGDFVLIAAVIVGFLLVGNAHRATGIKISRFGARDWAGFAAAVLGSLVLHSVSLGLASLDLRWWIAASASAAFVLVLWLTNVIFSSLRERLRNDR